MTIETYKIAEVSKLSKTVNGVGKKTKVSKTLFYELLEKKVKEITEEQPEKYEDVLKKVKDFLDSGDPLDVLNLQFQYIKK